MSLFQKYFYRKAPDRLLEISERVYAFDSCFSRDVMGEDEYKLYLDGIVVQLHDHYPDASFMVCNFRARDQQSQISTVLSRYGMSVMDYPNQHESFPLLPLRVISQFLISSESWLGQQNVMLMHCERGSLPLLDFMLSGLLLYIDRYHGDRKTLELAYNQASMEILLHSLSLNPQPSQLRYLGYISTRDLGSDWPPSEAHLFLDCLILRGISNFEWRKDWRPSLRVFGQDPKAGPNSSSLLLFSTPKTNHMYQQQEECIQLKLDIQCRVQGDIVLEFVNLSDNLVSEEIIFRIVFHTTFVRGNVLKVQRDEMDLLRDATYELPKEFNAEVLFSDADLVVPAMSTAPTLCPSMRGRVPPPPPPPPPLWQPMGTPSSWVRRGRGRNLRGWGFLFRKKSYARPILLPDPNAWPFEKSFRGHWQRYIPPEMESLFSYSTHWRSQSERAGIFGNQINRFWTKSETIRRSERGGIFGNRINRFWAKSETIRRINLRKAHNVKRILERAKMPPPDMMAAVLEMDESIVDADQIKKFIKVWPTNKEMKVLKNYIGDKVTLGKCEQYIIELTKVPRVESKLRVFSFKLQFGTQVTKLKESLKVVTSACKEIKYSEKLKEIMKRIFNLENPFNQGTVSVRSKLDWLLNLINTRAANRKMTLMHYLCKDLASKASYLLDFHKDLESLESASKIQLTSLVEEMQAIIKGLNEAKQELTASESDGPVSQIFHKSLKDFIHLAETELVAVLNLYSRVGRTVDALVYYFGKDPNHCPFEQVTGTLENFIRLFKITQEEKFEQLEKMDAAKKAQEEEIEQLQKIYAAKKTRTKKEKEHIKKKAKGVSSTTSQPNAHTNTSPQRSSVSNLPEDKTSVHEDKKVTMNSTVCSDVLKLSNRFEALDSEEHTG